MMSITVTNKTISLRVKKMRKRQTSAKMKTIKKVKSLTTKTRSKWIITCSNTQNYYWPSISQHLEDNKCSREFKPITIKSTKKIIKMGQQINRTTVIQGQVTPQMIDRR